MAMERTGRQRCWLGLILTVSTVGALTGCGIVDSEGEHWRSDYEAARARWERDGFTDYHYVVRQLCFCGYGGQEIAVEVRDGEVVSGTVVATGQALDPSLLEYTAPSVDGLFDRILQILDNDPHEFRASYDPELGYPVSVASDPIENAVDEEWGVEASGVEEIQ